MILIIGGSFQGKKAFAKELKPDIGWIDGALCGAEEIFSAGGIYHFHEYIRNRMTQGDDLSGFEHRLMGENPDICIVTNELGCGVVPIEAFDRAYRERTGRICTALARESREVYRVICGVGQRIKG